MDELCYSLRATAPVFLVMVLGGVFRRLGLVNEEFCRVSDKLVFRAALPVMLFLDMSRLDLRTDFDLPYVLFCAGVTTVIFFTLWGLARHLLRDKALVGEFVQAAYRSSAAILGCAILQSLYGSTGMAPLMILGSVPLFNIYAVVVLTAEGEKGSLGSRLGDTVKGVVTNPIILGILAGVIPAALGLGPLPPIAEDTLGLLARLATPLALLSLGAAFRGKDALGCAGPAVAAAVVKLLVLPGIFLPLGAALGFTGSKLTALLIMLGGASTPTCYVMARNLGHPGTLSASVIALTTVGSAFTLTLWIFLGRVLGLTA